MLAATGFPLRVSAVRVRVRTFEKLKDHMLGNKCLGEKDDGLELHLIQS